jgi:hypothetical protein
MEAATPIPVSRVFLRGERLLIDGLMVADECVVRLAHEREEAGEDAVKLILDALGIGARVLDREQASANAEFVRAEFERAARELDGEFVQRARVVAERFDAKIEEAFGAETGHVARVLERHFGEGSSAAVQNQVKAVVAEVMAKSREDLVRQFSSADGSNPLADFKSMAAAMMKQSSDRQSEQLLAMTRRLEEMRVEVASLRAQREGLEQLEAERERGTAKGRSYEELVFEAVDRIALAQGDACDAVGDLAEGARKTGDIVVGIDACSGPGRGRIVLEAKDRQLSRPKALEELDAALRVRSADYAILVVPSENEVPARMLPLREYNGDKLIVAYDPDEGSTLALQVAYSLARARVLMARGAADGVDVAAIGDTVARTLAAMEDVRRIKQQLTGARTQIDKAAEIVETMAARVRGHLAEIDALTQSAAAEDGDGASPT